MEKVTAIIPTFDRFKFLMNTIDSIKKQTYKNVEIIVVNDGSTQKKYYEYNWEENGIIIIHLEENSKKKFGYGCVGYIRNKGIERASGKYIAFCDDDDRWFPKKLQVQIDAMKKYGCKMSSTDGLIGKGVYDKNKRYKKYNAQHYYRTLQKIYRKKGSKRLDNGFPDIWDLKFLKVHNCAITSSVIVEKEILDKINGMTHKRRGQDYDCWLKALKYTNSVYIKDVCFYYNRLHGNGQNH
jgi:teichuronic acid biosynthesis glycosyltransferase TuaG